MFVFDICSSTKMIENLNEEDEVDKYNILIFGFDQFLNIKKDKYCYEIYKFLGDGYILLFDAKLDFEELLMFTLELTFFSEDILKWFIENYISKVQLSRIGITMAVTKGFLYPFRRNEDINLEYIGLPITLACRLQSTLKDRKHVNKLLMPLSLHRKIENYLLWKACDKKERIVPNIYDNTSRKYFEFNPIFFRSFDISLIKNPTTKLKKILLEEPDKLKMFRKLNKKIEEMKKVYRQSE